MKSYKTVIMRMLLSISAFSVVSSCSTTSLAVPIAGPTKILSVGHSLLGYPQLPAALNALAADAGITISTQKTQNIPGASINHNFNSPQKTHVDNYKVELAASNFDVFILTEAMPVQSHVKYSKSYRYANAFYDAVMADNPLTKFYIWQTWDCRANLKNKYCTDERTANGLIGQIKLDLKSWESIADEISKAHNNVKIPIMPGGQALIALDEAIKAKSVDGITDIAQLFDDEIHLNSNGWYFMALVQYATLYKASPVGLTSSVSSYPNTLSRSAVKKMQQIAWETVCGYARSGVSCVVPEPGCALDREKALMSASANNFRYKGNISMGNNLAAFAYWESSFPFADLRRQSDQQTRELGTWNQNGTGGVIDKDGNVVALKTGSVNKGLVLDAHCVYGGDYVVLWDQTKAPTVSLTHFGAGTLRLKKDEAKKGRRVYRLELPRNLTKEQYKGTNLAVKISAPITGNVDYHVLLPGTEKSFNEGNLFNPDFIKELENQDVVRFMDWLATNNSQVKDISDLPTMNKDTWARDEGVPYSVVMQLVKEANIPIAWITIPHLATNATMTEIAKQVYSQWQKGITVYIEFSNEVWNTGFKQTLYAHKQGAKEYPTLKGYSQRGTWLAQKSLDMKKAFVNVFGKDASAIKLVVSGHVASNSYVNPRDLAECYDNCRLKNLSNNIHTEIDVYAIAPYMSGALQGPTFSNANKVSSWSDSQLYNHINRSPVRSVIADIESIKSQLAEHKKGIKKITGRSDIEFAVYEFGQHISSFHDPRSALDKRFEEFQSTPEMGVLYHDLIQAMINIGVDTAAHFDLHSEHSVGFYWGNKQGIAGEITPRTQALEAAY